MQRTKMYYLYKKGKLLFDLMGREFQEVNNVIHYSVNGVVSSECNLATKIFDSHLEAYSYRLQEDLNSALSQIDELRSQVVNTLGISSNLVYKGGTGMTQQMSISNFRILVEQCKSIGHDIDQNTISDMLVNIADINGFDFDPDIYLESIK